MYSDFAKILQINEMNENYIKSNDKTLDNLNNGIYKDMQLQIALEKADKLKDWKSFNTILNINRKVLLQHLHMTEKIFKYNFKKLNFLAYYTLFLKEYDEDEIEINKETDKKCSICKNYLIYENEIVNIAIKHKDGKYYCCDCYKIIQLNK